MAPDPRTTELESTPARQRQRQRQAEAGTTRQRARVEAHPEPRRREQSEVPARETPATPGDTAQAQAEAQRTVTAQPAATVQEAGVERRGSTLAHAIPYVLAVLVLIGYFVWLISQMSIHAYGGASVPEATFGAVALGILAGGAAFVHRPRHGRSGS